MNIISPSLLAADFCNLSEEISRVKDAPWLHVDVMDGHFVPNLSIGVPVVESLKKATDKLLDVHLMIEYPLDFVNPFAQAGADLLCFHVEAKNDIKETIDKIKESGMLAGLAVKPKTSIDDVFPFLTEVDMVLIMTVEPGYGGQSFMSQMIRKISRLKKELDEKGLNVHIQVDGGINCETARKCVEAGADVLVAGSAVFNSKEPNEVVKALSAI